MAGGSDGRGDDVDVRFGANLDGLKQKTTEAANLIGGLGGQLGSFATRAAGAGQAASAAIGLMSGALGSFVALLAGGASVGALGHFADEASELNAQAERLSRTLGISAAEAGVLAIAVDNVSASLGSKVGVEAYEAAFVKFNQAIRSNRDELIGMGVDIHALESGQKSSSEVFSDALKIVGEYKDGVDQTQAAMRLFGRSVGDVQVLMRITSESLDDARQSAKDLNRTITQEGIAAAKQWRESVNNVGDVMEGLHKTIGEALMPQISAFNNAFASIGPALVEMTEASINAFVMVKSEVVKTLSALWSVISTGLGVIKSAWVQFFGNDGPGAMEIFKNALRLVHGAFVAFRVGVEVIAQAINTSIALLVSQFSTVGEVASRALKFDFRGAADAAREGIANYGKILAEGIAKAAEVARKGKEDIDDALLGTGTAAPPSKTPAGAAGGGGTKTFVQKDDSALAARNALMRAAQEAALALEREYLRQAGSIYDDAYRDNLISTREFYAAKLAIETAGVDATIAAKKREAQDASNGAAGANKESQRLQFQAQEKKLLGEIAVLEAKRNDIVRQNAADYEQAERKRTDALTGIRIGAEQAAATQSLDIERGAIEQRRALGLIDAQQAAQQMREIEDDRLSVTRRALEERLALARGDVEKRAQITAEMEQAERDHQQRLTEIDRAAELDRAKYALEVRERVKGGFEDNVRALMAGTKTLGGAFRDFALSVAQSIDNLVAKRLGDKIFDSLGGNKVIDMLVAPFESAIDSIVAMWMGKEQAETAATLEGTATRTAAEESAASESLLISAATAVKRIAIAAWEAAASVYAAIAAIPYVGPFLAPALAIAAGATVLGFAKNIASAEGGWWSVPGDQIANIHKDEMVLPAAEASGLRQVISSAAQGGNTRSSSGRPVQVSIHALDGASVERVLRNNPRALANAMREVERDIR